MSVKGTLMQKILQYIRLHIKNSITQIAHYNTFHFLRYALFKYAKCLFTNIQKQYSTLKSNLLFKKNTNFTGEQIKNSQDLECEISRILFSYQHKHMERFSNVHQRTFKKNIFVKNNVNYHSLVYAFRPLLFLSPYVPGYSKYFAYLSPLQIYPELCIKLSNQLGVHDVESCQLLLLTNL